MKNLKKLVTTLTLAGIIIIGVTNANAGMLMSDFTQTDNQPQACTETVDNKTIDTKVDNGILVGLTGILVGLTGILVGYNETPTDCGILVG